MFAVFELWEKMRKIKTNTRKIVFYFRGLKKYTALATFNLANIIKFQNMHFAKYAKEPKSWQEARPSEKLYYHDDDNVDEEKEREMKRRMELEFQETLRACNCC